MSNFVLRWNGRFQLQALLETGEVPTLAKVKELLIRPAWQFLRGKRSWAFTQSGTTAARFRWLLGNWCHRTGKKLNAILVPLYRQLTALSRLWLAFPPQPFKFEPSRQTPG